MHFLGWKNNEWKDKVPQVLTLSKYCTPGFTHVDIVNSVSWTKGTNNFIYNGKRELKLNVAAVSLVASDHVCCLYTQRASCWTRRSLVMLLYDGRWAWLRACATRWPKCCHFSVWTFPNKERRRRSRRRTRSRRERHRQTEQLQLISSSLRLVHIKDITVFACHAVHPHLQQIWWRSIYRCYGVTFNLSTFRCSSISLDLKKKKPRQEEVMSSWIHMNRFLI